MIFGTFLTSLPFLVYDEHFLKKIVMGHKNCFWNEYEISTVRIAKGILLDYLIFSSSLII